MNQLQLNSLRQFAFSQADLTASIEAYMNGVYGDWRMLGKNEAGVFDPHLLFEQLAPDDFDKLSLLDVYGNNADGSIGMCAAFGMAWAAIKLMDSGAGRHGAQSASRALQMQNPSVLQAATVAQTSWQNAAPAAAYQLQSEGGSSEDLHVGELLGQRQLSYSVIIRVPGSMGTTNATLSDPFIKRILAEKGSCTQLNFQLPAGRHAIAFYRSRGSHIYLFDANHGEYRVSISSFKDFFVSYLREYYHLQGEPPNENEGPIPITWTLWRWYYTQAPHQRGGKRYGAQRPQDSQEQTVW